MGMRISWAPARFISSRTMAVTRCRARKPSGRKVYMPEVSLRMKPPRTSSWWLMTSASDGISLVVGNNIWV